MLQKNSVEVFRYSDKVETVKSIENLKLLIISKIIVGGC